MADGRRNSTPQALRAPQAPQAPPPKILGPLPSRAPAGEINLYPPQLAEESTTKDAMGATRHESKVEEQIRPQQRECSTASQQRECSIAPQQRERSTARQQRECLTAPQQQDESLAAVEACDQRPKRSRARGKRSRVTSGINAASRAFRLRCECKGGPQSLLLTCSFGFDRHADSLDRQEKLQGPPRAPSAPLQYKCATRSQALTKAHATAAVPASPAGEGPVAPQRQAGALHPQQKKRPRRWRTAGEGGEGLPAWRSR